MQLCLLVCAIQKRFIIIIIIILIFLILIRLRKLSLIMCRIPEDLAESIQELPELKSLEVWPCLDKFLTSQEQVRVFF